MCHRIIYISPYRPVSNGVKKVGFYHQHCSLSLFLYNMYNIDNLLLTFFKGPISKVYKDGS